MAFLVPIADIVPPLDQPVAGVPDLSSSRPLPVQFGLWLLRALHGDLGNSIATGRPVLAEVMRAVSNTVTLAIAAAFLGLGTKPPEPEWGLMLNTLRTAIYVNPWVAALPGAMIFAVSICFNLLSDGLRSAMDIRN
jgi:hypothetical protein